ncbi:MAG: SAM hydrolase/SAM-dependent halogenase family protein [Phycisphaerae bacterium]
MKTSSDSQHRVITLTTDFGTRDYFVGAMKGVIHSIAPGTHVVDISHEISPQNIAHGAFTIRQILAYYPKGSIHVVVVDPGVGTERPIVAGRYEGRYVVAPDNGLFSLLHHDLHVEALHYVEDRRFFLPDMSSTFHGRDIMAPVAAHLANGVAIKELGRRVDRLEILPLSWRASRVGDSLQGRGLMSDHFGNIITSICQEQFVGLGVASSWEVVVNGTVLGGIRRTFADLGESELGAVWGSAGYLELVCNCSSAEALLGDPNSVEVILRPTDG